MGLALFQQGEELSGTWLCCLTDFRGNEEGQWQGLRLATDITETRKYEVQLRKHHMEAPSDAEPAALRSEEKAALTSEGLY